MLFSLLILLISNALTLRKDKSILFSRIVMVSLILTSFLAYNNLFFLPLDKGIGIFGGLFHVNFFTQIFNIFIYLISAVILALTSFYHRVRYIFTIIMLTFLLLISIKIPFGFILGCLNSEHLFFIVAGVSSALLFFTKSLYFDRHTKAGFSSVGLTLLVGSSIALITYFYPITSILHYILSISLPFNLSIIWDSLPPLKETFKSYKGKISFKDFYTWILNLNYYNYKLKFHQSEVYNIEKNTLFADNINTSDSGNNVIQSSSSSNQNPRLEIMDKNPKLYAFELEAHFIQILRQKLNALAQIRGGEVSAFEKSVYWKEVDPQDREALKAWAWKNSHLKTDPKLANFFNNTLSPNNIDFCVYNPSNQNKSIGKNLIQAMCGENSLTMSKRELLDWLNDQNLPPKKNLNEFFKQLEDPNKDLVMQTIKKYIKENSQNFPSHYTNYANDNYPAFYRIKDLDGLKEGISKSN